MKKNVTLVLTVLFIAAFSSCSRPEADTSIDLSADTPMSVFDMFSEVKIIPLETTPESFISDISEVWYHQSRYYVLDTRSQQIFCFTEQGDFVFKISAQGKGPGEYHYIANFIIDEKNSQLIVTDPVMQRLHFFDLQGHHLETRRIDIPNVLTKVYPLNDSVLLIYSLTKDQLVFYNLKQDTAVSALYDRNVPSTLEGFIAYNHVYQLDGRTYALPSLSQEMVDITDIEPVPHFSWCFGRDNNTPQQIEQLLQEIRNRQMGEEGYGVAMQGVGKGKVMTNSIRMVFETLRFMIALVEYDGQLKHVVIDKRTDETFVFNAFKENVGLPQAGYQSSRLITSYYSPPGEDFLKRVQEIRPDFPMEFYHRQKKKYSLDILKEEDKKLVQDYDPMNENPFLVVYYFRE